MESRSLFVSRRKAVHVFVSAPRAAFVPVGAAQLEEVRTAERRRAKPQASDPTTLRRPNSAGRRGRADGFVVARSAKSKTRRRRELAGRSPVVGVPDGANAADGSPSPSTRTGCGFCAVFQTQTALVPSAAATDIAARPKPAHSSIPASRLIVLLSRPRPRLARRRARHAPAAARRAADPAPDPPASPAPTGRAPSRRP